MLRLWFSVIQMQLTACRADGAKAHDGQTPGWNSEDLPRWENGGT